MERQPKGTAAGVLLWRRMHPAMPNSEVALVFRISVRRVQQIVKEFPKESETPFA